MMDVSLGGQANQTLASKRSPEFGTILPLVQPRVHFRSATGMTPRRCGITGSRLRRRATGDGESTRRNPLVTKRVMSSLTVVPISAARAFS